ADLLRVAQQDVRSIFMRDWADVERAKFRAHKSRRFNGQQAMARSQLSMVNGQWSMVNGSESYHPHHPAPNLEMASCHSLILSSPHPVTPSSPHPAISCSTSSYTAATAVQSKRSTTDSRSSGGVRPGS